MIANVKRKASKPRRRATPATPAAALADISLKDDCLLGTAEAARLVGLSPKSLRQLRCDRVGPRCFKLGSTKQARTVYRRSDLERWVKANVTSVTGGNA